MEPDSLVIRDVQGFCAGECKPGAREGFCDDLSSAADVCADPSEEYQDFCDRRSRMFRGCREAVQVCSSQQSEGCKSLAKEETLDACEQLLDNGSCLAMREFCSASESAGSRSAVVDMKFNLTQSGLKAPTKVSRSVYSGTALADMLLHDDGNGADKTASDMEYSGLMELRSDAAEIINGQLQEKIKLERKELPSESWFVGNLESNQKSSIPNSCDSVRSVDDKTVFWTSTSVVEDPSRTIEPCNAKDMSPSELNAIDLDSRVWSFGHLMDELAGDDIPTHVFIREWLNEWKVDRHLGNDTVAKRTQISNIIQRWEDENNWVKHGTGMPKNALDPKLAPFRLLAIVNRNDLADSGGPGGYTHGEAGEGRLVFGLVDTDSCGGSEDGAVEFTVIVEYKLPHKSGSCTSKEWAKEWQDLEDVSSSNFNQELANITTQFTENDGSGSGPNGSHLSQLRTNEIHLASPWQLREFHIRDCADANQASCCQGIHPGSPKCPINGGEGILDSAHVAQTPNQDMFRDAPGHGPTKAKALVEWINDRFPPAQFSGTLPAKQRRKEIRKRMFVPNGAFGPGDVRGAHSNTTFTSSGNPLGPQASVWWDPEFTDSSGTDVKIIDRKPAGPNSPMQSMRFGLSFRSCNGCHGGATANVSDGAAPNPFTHVDTRSIGTESTLSKFLEGQQGSSDSFSVQDPVDGDMVHKFNQIKKRKLKLKSRASGMCIFEHARVPNGMSH